MTENTMTKIKRTKEQTTNKQQKHHTDTKDN